MFECTKIKVNDLAVLWPDSSMTDLNYCKKILVFADEYTQEEYDEIYRWFTEVIILNHLSSLNRLVTGFSQANEYYEFDHALIRKKVIYIENCDLQTIETAKELYDFLVEGYEIYYICSTLKEE